jgi:hypothetical protein
MTKDLETEVFQILTCERIQRIKRNIYRKDEHIKYYEVIAAPTLMYESVNWTLNTSERWKTGTGEVPSFESCLSIYTYRPCAQYNTQYVTDICFRINK